VGGRRGARKEERNAVAAKAEEDLEKESMILMVQREFSLFVLYLCLGNVALGIFVSGV